MLTALVVSFFSCNTERGREKERERDKESRFIPNPPFPLRRKKRGDTPKRHYDGRKIHDNKIFTGWLSEGEKKVGNHFGLAMHKLCSHLKCVTQTSQQRCLFFPLPLDAKRKGKGLKLGSLSSSVRPSTSSIGGRWCPSEVRSQQDF